MSRLKSIIFLFFALLMISILTPVANAQNGDNNNGQDTSEVLRMVETYSGDIPVRRGYFIADIKNRYSGKEGEGEGFGYDKARWKHGVTAMSLIDFIMRKNARILPVTNGQNNWTGDLTGNGDEGLNFFKQVSRSQCYIDPWADIPICVSRDVFDMVVAVNLENYDRYYGVPAGNPVGLQTAYCDGYPGLCPPWVNSYLAEVTA